MQRLHAPEGFTLIEAMVGITVLGILIAVAVPSFNSLIQSYRVSAYANEFYAFLSKARSEAIKRNANVYVSFQVGDDWCIGMSISSACSCGTAGSCDLQVMNVSAPGRVTLSTAGYTGGNFYFEGAHGMASTAGNVTFTNYTSSDYVMLTVSRMGGAKICASGIGGYTSC